MSDSIKFDVDERAATQLIRKYPDIFIPEYQMGTSLMLKMVSFRGDIADLIFDARVEERMRATGEDHDTASDFIFNELKKTEE